MVVEHLKKEEKALNEINYILAKKENEYIIEKARKYLKENIPNEEYNHDLMDFIIHHYRKEILKLDDIKANDDYHMILALLNSSYSIYHVTKKDSLHEVKNIINEEIFFLKNYINSSNNSYFCGKIYNWKNEFFLQDDYEIIPEEFALIMKKEITHLYEKSIKDIKIPYSISEFVNDNYLIIKSIMINIANTIESSNEEMYIIEVIYANKFSNEELKEFKETLVYENYEYYLNINGSLISMVEFDNSTIIFNQNSDKDTVILKNYIQDKYKDKLEYLNKKIILMDELV